ncbi:MAG TPA: YggT family protein [Gemmatimonadaceae bacterium]|nr:YggT family protein [Gemmatimonadaceae bacterium]
MSILLSAIDALLPIVRVAFLGAAVVATALCTADWLVRTRRLSPFSGAARFIRSSVDPLLAPVERRIVRAGGSPTSAPWWGLAAVIVGGIVVLSLLGFLRGQLAFLAYAAGAGPGGLLRLAISWTFSLLQIALIVRVLSSWIRVSPYSPWIRWSFVLTEWLLRPLRQVVPTIGMIDITPIIAYFALSLLERLFLGMM